mmetsp:Transcript_14300/g.44631  ORF Transcript_14300/g.44631 Transcript_14300/m.44631 type:complete len:204 (+) Transcript_14300:190-801(+)
MAPSRRVRGRRARHQRARHGADAPVERARRRPEPQLPHRRRDGGHAARPGRCARHLFRPRRPAARRLPADLRLRQPAEPCGSACSASLLRPRGARRCATRLWRAQAGYRGGQLLARRDAEQRRARPLLRRPRARAVASAARAIHATAWRAPRRTAAPRRARRRAHGPRAVGQGHAARHRPRCRPERRVASIGRARRSSRARAE